MLSARERAVLRLLAQGHDAKSSAHALGLSVHTINERLRTARRTLGASSSREAARKLAEIDGARAQEIGGEIFGVGAGPLGAEDGGRSEAGGPLRSAFIILPGAFVMIIIVSAGLAVIGNQAARNDPAASDRPRIVATLPAADAVIPPGPFTLSVTFDQPMRDGSYSFVRISPDTYPDCAPRPTLSDDARTFSLRCTAKPGARYRIGFNRSPYMNFTGRSGVPARPMELAFAVEGN
ncbi:LuxR C-terminal-related transcriptional regulator [Sphingomonas qilianensis]|uniref:LuxR C-terminal-related transcriptional regulator n=1 Tax=Sphingomonas qilianensis TaxID=1736690 RepID=A0ABU9XQU0_9SPHN